MKKVSILGSTGSIGTQTLEVISRQDEFKVLALSAGGNIKLLEEQARKYNPEIIAVWKEQDAITLRTALKDKSIKVLSGMEGLITVATYDAVDIVVTAIVGMLGIRPTIEAIKAHKNIALANKETLVTAGHIIMPMVKKYGVSLLPVDSEHSAIFQCLQTSVGNEIEKIWLTASGGPFRGKSIDELRMVTVEDALKHPNWSMGKKITIDSATMVNKGLEIIEAGWLFDVSLEQINVLVHPQSIIHSAVEFKDGAVIAQMGVPDMRLPIQYALCYPERRELPGKRLDFYELGTMSFEAVDEEVFRGLSLAKKAMYKGGNLPTVFNAANEKAVELFLGNKIRFLEIVEIIEACMRDVSFCENPTVDDIIGTQMETEEYIESRC